MGFEESETALGILIAGLPAPGDQNEATTRLQLIDRLMFECLGWDRNDCIAEERLEGSIADYAFYSPQRLLIVEAKREGSTFEVPVGNDHAHKRPIAFFRKHAPAVYEAIEQCVRYCQERGTNFGVVSNGRQYIAFLASRLDGIPPLEGDCLVLPSIDAIRADFVRT